MMKVAIGFEALERAREIAGGSSALARKLGITPQAVLQWKNAPAERVLGVERETGVSRYDLRPDVFGSPTADPVAKSCGPRDVFIG